MASVTARGTAHLNLDPDAQFLERFYTLVDVCAPTDCWLWKGKSNRKGYGYLGYANATHISLWLAGMRRDRSDQLACHHCDNPSCVNPFHLWWGTNKENMLDSAAKGRQGHLYEFNKLPKSAEHKANIGIALKASPKFRAHMERLHTKKDAL
jgi:hypothetical protein